VKIWLEVQAQDIERAEVIRDEVPHADYNPARVDPVALALVRQGFSSPSVSRGQIRAQAGGTPVRAMYSEDHPVAQAVLLWDRKLGIEPFKCELSFEDISTYERDHWHSMVEQEPREVAA